MSMNLHWDKLELCQTPTWVTNMCMIDSNEPDKRFLVRTGIEARRALYCYLIWCSSTGPKIASTDEEYRQMSEFRDAYEEHRRDVLRMIEVTPIDDLEVYSM